MGLDIALGLVILVAGLRGWFKGFVVQAIGIGALVGCIYLAEPVRDLARPIAHEHLSALQPGLLDTLLWWAAAVLSYVVLSGVALSLVRLARDRAPQDADVRRGARGLGFLLGAAKGALVALFLAAGIVRYAPKYAEMGGWIGEQVRTSQALKVSTEHRPAERIWNSLPVQALVSRVRRGGFWTEPEKSPNPTRPAVEVETARPAERSENPPADRVAVRPRVLKVPPAPPPALEPGSPHFREDLDAALEREGILDEADRGTASPDRP